MQAHLEEISRIVAPGAHAVVRPGNDPLDHFLILLTLDQAGWHTSTSLAVPDNISLLPLPPRCPELNPVENLWQYMRENWLSNLIFASYDDIVAICCAAWRKLIERPGLILSIGMRDWINEF